MDKRKKIINDNINKHIDILLKQNKIIIEKSYSFSQLILKKIKNGQKIMVCGNGGSASDAQHISTELTVRLKKNRAALPALALTTDTSALTAIGNDFNFSKIFSRQIEAVGKKGDILLAISTSGNSQNIIEALKTSKEKKIFTFGLLGNKGGKCKKYCDDYFIVNDSSPSRIQEIHILFYHAFCELVENEF